VLGPRLLIPAPADGHGAWRDGQAPWRAAAVRRRATWRAAVTLALGAAALATAMVAEGACRGPGAGNETGADGGRIAPAGWSRYVDRTHGFSVAYPRGFVARTQDVSRFAAFRPAPVASVFFMNPTMAAGALAGIEPPDLEVRVYRAGATASLEPWLRSADLLSAGDRAVARHHPGAGVGALEVCRATMIAPGCSVYILHGHRVYQLTPISLEGQAMLDTFTLLSGAPAGPPDGTRRQAFAP
jgi:hypothetical protein